MPNYSAAMKAYDSQMRRTSIKAITAGRIAWHNVSQGNLSASWDEVLGVLVPQVIQLQRDAALASLDYTADALAAQSIYRAPTHFSDPLSFTGAAADGRPLNSLLLSPVLTTKQLIGDGASVYDALKVGGGSLDMLLKTTIADTGRAAAGVDVASRTRIGFTRMLNLPSCGRCVILAGRYYRWNQGFSRHPRCDCRHIPTSENIAGASSTDPYEAFNSYTAAQQDKLFGKASAQAIRDGADISQVVNARRGMAKAGSLTTTEGTTRRGNFRAQSGRQRRLTPQAIYDQHPNDRAAALKALESNGYILPGGQNPLGSLRGQREGFGALGRGGTRVGARSAVEQVRVTGQRNPATRATMTEAERRAFDAQANWTALLEGRNPFSARRPLTPQLSAAIENDYRRIVVRADPTGRLSARRDLA